MTSSNQQTSTPQTFEVSLVGVLKFVWLLPATILVWLFYIVPLLLKKEITYSGRVDTFIWSFKNPITSSWYDNQWHKWAGWSGPCVYLWKDLVLEHENRITRVHEVQHCKDQFNWGVFFYPAYFCHSAWIWIKNLFRKREDKQHIYYDNYFERRARAAAGQLVDIPRSMWPDGPDDYNPWL